MRVFLITSSLWIVQSPAQTSICASSILGSLSQISHSRNNQSALTATIFATESVPSQVLDNSSPQSSKSAHEQAALLQCGREILSSEMARLHLE
jgi:hypothetical protein